MNTEGKMTAVLSVNKAINRARKWVKIIPYGRGDFVIQEWRPDCRAFSESHHMDYHQSQSYAKESRLRIAFDALGYDDETYPNQLYQEEGRWDVLLRDYVAKGI
jgi:hypothetical protein